MARARPVAGLTPADSFRSAAGKVVATRTEELFDHAAGVLDTADIERVHDMRVATRRLRAVLEIFAPCLPRKRHAGVLAEVKVLADALGERRDPDVHIDALGKIAAALPAADQRGIATLVDRFRDEQAGANAGLEEALAEAERADLRGRLHALAEATER